jgi:putative peptidoglycan lipid II flippase
MLGIASSRVLGLVREVLLAFVGGAGAATDVLAVAFRGPNLVQNLLGDQALSAAFVPVYSRFLAEGRRAEARRFAGAVFGILALAAGALALGGALLARWLILLLAPGFGDDPQRFEVAVEAARWIFPMTALLVLSAWCLAILNSHRRFFLPYFAPVLWNASLVAALLWLALRPDGPRDVRGLVLVVSVAALVGGALQLAVQVPATLRLLGGIDPRPTLQAPGVPSALRSFGPAVVGRGVVQLSGWLDLFLGSWLAVGALSALNYAQRLHSLPLALFGTSFAVVDLPELARSMHDQTAVARRIAGSFAAAAFLTVPAAVGLVLFGLPVVRAVYERGEFGGAAAVLVYAVLACYALALVPSVGSRLRQNVFLATGDTKTPAAVALGRVLVGAGVGAALMLWLDRYPIGELLPAAGASDDPTRAGAVGLAAGSAVGAWLELWVLGRALERRRLAGRLPWRRAALCAVLALCAAVPTGALWWFAESWPPVWLGPLLVVLFAAVYLGTGWVARLAEARSWLGSIGATLGKRREPGPDRR